MKILVTGPIGSGKTTQAQFIAKTLNLPLIKTGDVIRRESQKDTNLAHYLKHAILEGILVSPELVINLMRDEIKKVGDSFICDSYPRSMLELKVYDPNFDYVVYIHIPDEEIHNRLLKRGRMDDNEKTIQKRIEVYTTETAPLLDYYRTQNKLIEIDGVGTEQEVNQRVKLALDKIN